MNSEEKGDAGLLRAEAAVLLERAALIDGGLRLSDPVSAGAMREVHDASGAVLVAAIREGRQGLGKALRLLSRIPDGSETETFRCVAECVDQLDTLLAEMQPVYVVKL